MLTRSWRASGNIQSERARGRHAAVPQAAALPRAKAAAQPGTQGGGRFVIEDTDLQQFTLGLVLNSISDFSQ